jgi:hypothetical protein
LEDSFLPVFPVVFLVDSCKGREDSLAFGSAAAFLKRGLAPDERNFDTSLSSFGTGRMTINARYAPTRMQVPRNKLQARIQQKRRIL